MQFNTYSYFLFLAIAAIVFWSLPERLRRAYVLVVSLLFYASWNVYFLVLPLIICASTYVCAMMARWRAAEARVWIWSGVGFVLCVLVFFKYGTFLVMNLSAVTGSSKFLSAGIVTGVVLPLGISFYSFEAMSYLFDSQQGRVSSTSFLDLALFIMFWPHLIAGPIVRVRELVPQLKFDRKFEIGFVLQGLDRVVWGLVQKNVFANSIGPWVDNGFVPGAASLNTALDNWFLAAAFGLQIYFDFAAYTNIAIGSAQLIGVKLPENFRYPYHAVTPPEFWSRWHMTLSRWIRDYLFFPLNARYKGSPASLYLSLIAAMAVVGLWHGAGWGFVFWGVLHGIYLVVFRMFEGLRDRHFPKLAESRLIRAAWRIFTLVAVTAAWIPFRAASFTQTRVMLSSMFLTLDPRHLTLSYSVNFYLVTLLLAVFCAVEPYLGKLFSSISDAVSRNTAALVANMFVFRPVLYACGLLLFMIFDERDTRFIYFQF